MKKNQQIKGEALEPIRPTQGEMLRRIENSKTLSQSSFVERIETITNEESREKALSES